MRVCMISKFPPIEGGIASRTYWLARGLSEEGLSIDIVTNSACVEPEYRIENIEGDFRVPEEFAVHNLDVETPWHIPFSKNYQLRLLNLLLKVIRDKECDIIDSGYLVPYGVVGWIASSLTGLPHIVRHGGSDLSKFLNHPEYSYILKRVINEAAVIVSDKLGSEVIKDTATRFLEQPAYIADEQAFDVPREQHIKPVFAYVGKVNFHWERKCLDRIVECFEGVPDDKYRLLFVAQGNGVEDFLRSIGKSAKERIEFRRFVPPWEMPRLLSSIDYIFDYSKGDPIQTVSFLTKEALAAGTQAITNRNSTDDYGDGLVRMWPPSSEKIFQLIQEWKIKEIPKDFNEMSFKAWILSNIETYKSALL